ncbi:serine/threonine-protein kinase [Colwellia psychrerythraea]|uniref:Serine/threonine protein kinase n=1 Tax=Colwellia psychrerythraea TaxID=28229 RepID=A0A099L079_COLPS|nr:serine/threonine-protein kinase [Colwellia psychrerythraea]KGJ96266.1 serine/threonine protein kinase [Colwellia psychrerythraea]
MIQRILPIYHTGWFYLLLLFWGSSFWLVANGGLKQINQLNINALAKTTQNQVLSNNSAFESPDILTLYSTFDDSQLDTIVSLLSDHQESQVTLLGEPSSHFTSQLERYLSKNPRNNKIIIASKNNSSEPALKSPSPMLFSGTLDWFRYSSKNEIEQVSSKHLIYTPFIINQSQSFSLLWQQQGGTYLTLPSEILKQLSKNNELTFNKNWQLNLANEQNTQIPQKLKLGFFGDIFTSGETYQYSQVQQTRLSKFDKSTLPLISVKQFFELDYNSPDKQKIIIITDNKLSQHELLQPLLDKLIKGDYLTQDISTILLCWALTGLGLTLVWFISQLTFKQQLIAIISYCLVLFIIQYLMFRQQQWLEVFQLIFLLMGSWLLFLAYHKECHLLLAAVNEQLGQLDNNSLTIDVMGKPKKIATKKSNTAQKPVHSLLSQAQEKTKPAQDISSATMTKGESSIMEGFEQTLVILDKQVQSNNSIKHHLTVDNFGRYQVEGILGKGAMGIVYQGVDPKINRHVAIKTLQLSDDIDSPEFGEAKERFFREAQTAGGLSHANIVTIYDVGEENNLGYIAMDLLTGAPLSLFTQPEQTLPVPLVYQLLIQITDALDYAHNQNVVHRDIKPANIIYDDDLLKVTVTDFGIAYVSDNSKTRTGIIMGSPYYMSPEQILGLRVDGRSDIFSLGVTFYQLLCGHLPFEGESIATVAYQITKAKAVAVNQLNSKLPSSAQRICSKAMHKDIEKRYQSMAEFKLALTNALKRDFKVTTN